MTALIGAPAYATMAENEPENIRPEIIESVLPDIASEEATLAVDFIGKTATESDAIPSADNSTEEKEEFTDIPEEKEETAEENIEEEATAEDSAEAPSDPVISEEDILDYIQSEEVQDALEDAGVDSEEIEEEIENGNYEVIYITQEEYEQMRKDEALSVFTEIGTILGESAALLLLIPATPLFICIPFAGPFLLLIPLAAPVIFVASAVGMVFSPVISAFVYYNYELDPRYEIVE